MGYPEDRASPPGSGNGAYYNGPESSSRDPMAMSNGQSGQAPHSHGGPNSSGAPDRPDRYLNPNGSDPDRVQREKRRPSGQQRICGKCQKQLTGQFVRALGDTFHLECFTCHDCGKIVASKFFPVPDHPPNQYPLCETDYFRRLDLLCYACGGALRGSYITALDRKYHIEHFTCSVCPTVFGASDSYYEHEGSVYCHYHYSTKFAQKCNGCQTAILKQFVEIFRNGVNQHWHPECYMIHKYWNVRLHAPPAKGSEAEAMELDRLKAEAAKEAEDADEATRTAVRKEEEAVERKVHWIWQTLSTFEERSATCISDMLLHVSNGGYMDGVVAAKKFITHVDLLFSAADDLDHRLQTRPGTNGDKSVRTFDSIAHPGLSYSREAKLLCKKVVAFFQLLAESQDTGVRRLGVTQELLSLVTGLAHYLKLMIRICLSGALKLERDTGTSVGLESFLQDISKLDERLETESQRDAKADTEQYVSKNADTCLVCNKAVEDKCYRLQNRVLHTQCLNCSRCGRDFSENPGGARFSEQQDKVFCDPHAPFDARPAAFVAVTRLQQYVHLLRVAHARLLATLRTSGALPHTSDDPNLLGYNATAGHSADDGGPPLLRPNTRSKSYAGRSALNQTESSYEDAMGDIRRLRSTRMDKHLSNAGRHARKSQIIGGPEGVRPGSSDDASVAQRRQTGSFQIIQDADPDGEPMSQLTFGKQDAMTLDDIPRIVQAQQTREQRPNASKFARQPMIPQEPKPRLVNGHTRDFSGEGDKSDGRGQATKKYFSELTALEYFIIRHVAILSMEPLLEGHFNQEELLKLIETKSNNFWAKFGRAFNKDNSKKTKAKAIFGVPIDQLLEKDYEESTDCVGPGSLKVPSLVQEAVSAMKTMDMSVEGVFRKNGNIKRLNDVKEQIDSTGAVEVDLTKENPVQVAALLKKFLREMPDPLLTHKLNKLWITSQKIDDAERRRRILHLTCCLMPKPHRDTMEVLFTFLNWVSSFSHVDEESGSKMDIHNLATVITPNIIHRGKEHVPVEDSFLAIEAVHSLIECNESMCEVPEDLALVLNDSTLFSNNAELTTKEILRRYGDRAKAPVVNTPAINSTKNDTYGDASSPAPQTSYAGGYSNRDPGVPVIHRVDTDPNMATAWQNESSVRHVGSDLGTPPAIPYAHPRSSQDSHGSPNRSSMRSPAPWEKRQVGMA